MLAESDIQILTQTYRVPEELRAQVQPRDVLIASYPRSGNSWVRWILSVYFMKLAGLEHPHNFGPGKVIPDIHAEGVIPPYEMITGLGHRLIKSHQTAQFPENRCIYLVRKPADCLLSYYHFLWTHEMARLRDRDITTNASRPSRLQILRGMFQFWRQGPDGFALKSLPNWIRQQKYMLRIRAERPELVCLLTYEALHRQGFEAVKTMLHFLEAPVVDEHIRGALQFSRIDNLRSISKIGLGPSAFYRKGKVGESGTVLRAETLVEIEAQAGDLYRQTEQPKL